MLWGIQMICPTDVHDYQPPYKLSDGDEARYKKEKSEAAH